LFQRAVEHRPDRVGDRAPLELGKEALAVEALVGAQEDADASGQSTQALVQEAGRAGRSGGVAVAELRVQPLPGLGDKTDQRMPGDLAGVDAAGPLPGADRTVMLDVARVQIERQR